MSPDDRRHGTIAGYSAHIKSSTPIGEDDACGCRAARTRYENERRLKVLAGQPRLVPTLGLRRRVDALRWVGWTLDQIAVEAGWLRAQNLDQLLRGKRCSPRSAARVIRAYERLSRQAPPETHGTKIARAVARQRGCAPAAAWDSWDDPAERPKGVARAA